MKRKKKVWKLYAIVDRSGELAMDDRKTHYFFYPRRPVELYDEERAIKIRVEEL